MCWDGVTNLLDGIIGDLELIAVGIDQLGLVLVGAAEVVQGRK